MIFAIYKPGQGKYTRLYSGFAAAIVVGYGCWQLHGKLRANDLGLWVETMVPASLFVALAALIFWLINKRSVADFMIAAEAELKKVNWSSRHEIAVSTFVVIAVSLLLAFLLGATDITFQLLFKWLLG